MLPLKTVEPGQQRWVLPRFEGLSATETCRRIIRDAIVEGRIPAGAQLRESRLVEMLGISRGTVREALRHLVQEGIVEYQLHRGAFVRSQELADRLDVYVAREAIEVWAARRLVEGEATIDFSPLDEALATMRIRAARQRRPTEETIAADLRFHHELVRLAGSERLTRAHETFAAECRMLLRMHPPYPWRTYATDHQELVDALRRRDPRTPELVAQHLRLSARLIGGDVDSSGEEATRAQ
ncbi:MAG TPA: GntR family transcriptional regulator [Candidatus Limnocylindrales bacterium]|nr:GntR family transcriptional regulator [Candidatus Limnocylindrales bacterium]